MTKTETVFNGFDLVLGMLFFVLGPASVLFVAISLNRGNGFVAVLFALLGGVAVSGMFSLTSIHRNKKTNYRAWKIAARYMRRQWKRWLEHGFVEGVPYYQRYFLLGSMSIALIFLRGGIAVLILGIVLALIF